MALVTDSYGIAFTIVSLFLTLVWYLRTRSSSFRYRLPPGPVGFPVIGILPYMGAKNPWVNVLRMSKHYGTVFGGFLGSYRAVFLNDYDTIKETFSRTDDVFNDRPRISMFELFSDGQGVVCCYIENHWKEQRRFTLRALRNYGMGRLKGSLRDAIDIETKCLMDEFAKIKKPFNPADYLAFATCDITCNMVFGKRYDYDDATYLEFIHRLERIFELADVAGVVNYLRWMKYVPFSGYNDMGDCVRHLENGLFTRESDEHQKAFDPNREPRDLIDSFLIEMHKKQQERLNNNGEGVGSTAFTYQQLLHFIADIFAAGTDTTATTLKWTLLHLSKFQDVQRKMQEELDRVVGRDRIPTLEDKPNLPYNQAVLAESLRFASPGPFGVPHGAKEDTKLQGFDIPKGTVVIANIYAVLYDPKVFPEPATFNPMRFLDEEGRLKTSLVERAHSQFGIGRRGCPGMESALMQRFSFITNLVHRFTLTAPNGADAVRLDAKNGLSCAPLPFEIKLTER